MISCSGTYKKISKMKMENAVRVKAKQLKSFMLNIFLSADISSWSTVAFFAPDEASAENFIFLHGTSPILAFEFSLL